MTPIPPNKPNNPTNPHIYIFKKQTSKNTNTCKMQPLQLPIKKYHNKILTSIQNNRVVVISGRTGCGKSTQVPKYILNSNPKAYIAICQPRRLAATSLAHRVSSELGETVGNVVGYQIGMESKYGENTRVVYMTYGILIQQLLFQDKIQYTHIILDEVHERSLQMDFTFIALKKILDSQPQKTTKVIIMSATINSSQFSKHFSTHIKTSQFLRPTLTYNQNEIKQSTSSRRCERGRAKQSKLVVDVKFETKDYIEAESIQLPDENKYKIVQYFADQIQWNMKKDKIIPQYTLNQDVRIKDDTFRLAVGIIDEQLRGKDGDVLVFVPGMFQIKFLKDMLIQSAKVDPHQIIEVHSAYSDQLYHRLFEQKTKNKIILATNIGQSSITLPYCKTVIDFCLNRKNITIKIKGYSRFQTRVASKANLMQRAGRVGRISDGTVYRLIPKSLYAGLDDFDIPEIQCVSLDMVILRAKQIDKTYNSTLFQDIYQVIFNAIEPPKFEQIHSAIEYLLSQQALIQISSQKSTSSSSPSSSTYNSSNTTSSSRPSKYICSDLKITKMGQFMVSMPCNIRLSKMILYSLELGITSTMVDIAAILLTQKPFFVHQEKRVNIQEWMHSIVGYDRGYYNDFLMRQRMYSHWRSIYFQPLKKKLKPQTYRQKNTPPQSIDSQKILQTFNNERPTQTQWGWCNDRGISPWVMRDILRISENIKDRLNGAEIKFEKNKEEVQNQMVIYCLCVAFQDTTCMIQWNGKMKVKGMGQYENWVSVIQSERTTQKNLHQYMQPLKNYKITYQKGGFIKITGPPQAISKLLLPRHYTKSNPQTCSPLFRYLCSIPPKSTYLYQSTSIRERVREVTILNDSINKVNIRPNHNLDYMLITDKIFDSKGKYYMGACALVEKKVLVLLKMMSIKNVKVQLHVCGEFYVRVYVNQDRVQLPFLLGNDDVEVIREFRKLNQEQRSKKLTQPQLIQNRRRSKFLKLLSQTPLKPQIQPWTYIFNQVVQKYKILQEQPIPIDQCPRLREIDIKNSYFERYKRWKVQEHEDLYYNFRLLTIKKGSMICSKCWPKHITIIQDLQSFCTDKKILKLNQYRGSWVQDKNNLLCSRKHKIGSIINSDEGSIEYQSILMYSPYCKIAKFDGQKTSIDDMLNIVEEGVAQIERQKRKYYQFQCKICSSYDQYQRLNRCILEKGNLDTPTFWKKITDHMYSKKHIDNVEKFLIFV